MNFNTVHVVCVCVFIRRWDERTCSSHPSCGTLNITQRTWSQPSWRPWRTWSWSTWTSTSSTGPTPSSELPLHHNKATRWLLHNNIFFLSFCFSFLSTSKTRGRCLPQEGGRHAAVRQHRLQADLVCHGEAGGERPRQVHRPVQLQQPADRRRPLCGQHQTHRAAGASCILTPDRFNVHAVLAGFGFNALMAFWCVAGGGTPLPGSGGAAGPLSGPGPGDDGLQPSGISWPRLETSRWTCSAAGARDHQPRRQIQKVARSDYAEVIFTLGLTNQDI